ncbi:MAG: leucine-rich repeat domain-containing protein [Gemmatimonadota bacterium]|nr:leucine-rich repeat domain-containing protein [Gemmatimonadota bacterium]
MGETVQFSAAVLDQNGQPVDGAVVTWSSSDEAVATVSPQGLVTAVSNGTAQITARAGNASASVTVTVAQSAVRITITPAEATLIALGETVQFSAAVLDQNGQPVDGAVVAWLSSDEAVATVSPQGLVTAVMNGTVQITARSGTVSSHVTVQIMDVRRDRDALIALYHATNGPDWSNNTNWLSDHPLNTWNGVHTNSHGEVERLELNGNNLQGYLPHEITRLINLRWLLLGDNQLTGAIPPEFGQLQNLWQLYLVNNQLTGTIPIELGQLKNLYSLSLGKNQLTGVIPPELGRLEELRDLSLSNNQLTGTIPVELGQLKNLGTLNIGSNVLTGAIPSEIGQLSKLESLVVAGNFALSGPLPEELTKLENLELIVLENTQICVPPTTSFQEWLENIPIKIGVKHCTSTERDALNALYDRTDGTNWTNSTNWTSFTSTGDWFGVTTDADGKVTKLVLQDNNMSGTLPSLLSDLASLEVLDLSFNNGLEGNLPFSFTKLDLQELLLEGTQVCVPLIPEFQTWLNGIPHRNVSNCAETRRDYYPLAALYYSTNGQEWTNSTNWLSDAPLRTWHGVYTNSDGRVTSLFLSNNRLSGRIPPELGQLNNLVELSLSLNLLTGPIPPELGQLKNLTDLHLQGNRISEAIPSEIGQLENLKYLSLIGNRMTGAIPPEIGQLKNLTNLNLFGNKLTGSLPPELGQLHNLRNLDLEGNRLAGTIPSEIGQLRNLERLALGFNNLLSGDIPPEIGQLTNLTQLRLGYNALSGTIPAVLGKLRNLSELGLFRNSLEGVIPIEIGQLQNLRVLWLNENQLTGTIPPQLGDLRNLESLDLSSNHFTGEIPPELGQLIMLDELRLSYNELTGNIPISFADLASLKLLGLTGNSAMSGYLPRELIRLKLDEMLLGGTALCAPADAEFQGWIQTIPNSRVARCTVNQGGSTFYLTQATQSLRFPVPLVAGDDALLRVFLTSPIGVDATIPTVRATIFDRDFKVFDVDIPGNGVPIPQRINEGDLTTTANARIPGSIITPGIEMVIEIDPDGELDPSLGISGRMPVTGRTALDVREMPPFDLTLVPFLWTENPDYDFVNRVNALTSDDDLFRPTRDLLPVADFELSVREPVWIPVEPVFGNPIRRYVIAVRAMDGASGYYMGVLIGHGGGTNRKSPVITSGLQPSTIAHEFGHSMSLPHAPCGPVVGADPDYPYPDGTIGAWGYDLLEESLVNPDTPDLMSYCGPRRWISDYNFKKAMGFRLSEEQESLVASSFTPSTRSLLLWGGVNSSGEIILEPVFVVSAPPSPPQLGGLYEIVGEDQEGRTLFSVSFDMPEVEDAEEKAFAFILPVQTAWATSLQSITLSGPEGVSSLDGEDDPTAALLLDQSSGQVRGLLSDWPGPSTTLRAARRSPPEPGLEVVISKGVPEEEDWER